MRKEERKEKNGRKVMCTLLIFLFSLLICGCGSSPSASSAAPASDELDVAIRDTSDYLNDNIPEGSKIVILNIQSDSPDLSDYIIDELIANAVNDRIFSVVDRQQLDIIRQEQNFQWAGEVDDNMALEVGRFFGAQTIVSGAVSPLGERYRLRVRALEVQTAQVQGQYNRNMTASPTLNDLMKSGGGTSTRMAAVSGNRPTSGVVSSGGAGGQTAQPAAPTEPAGPPLPSYKIGDTGPAGGFIFYDKGNNSSGWRYLEAGPLEIEFMGIWSVRDTKVVNTQATIGSGKRNTELAVEAFKQATGEWDTAPQKVAELEFNEFNDWFIPSRDELDQMYGNLKRKNLGDFKNGWYWSSTVDGGPYIYTQNFENGLMSHLLGSATSRRQYIRPIRQVVGPVR